MQCPTCKQTETQVIDSRVCFESVRRRRECLHCKNRFTTFERVEKPKLYIIKKDGRREIFDRNKIQSGIIKACEKRPISQNIIITTVIEIEKELFELGQNEIKSQQIGEIVMKRLKKLDKVAYIRFASVYRSFDNISQFEREIKNI